jgi:hypothetical protein
VAREQQFPAAPAAVMLDPMAKLHRILHHLQIRSLVFQAISEYVQVLYRPGRLQHLKRFPHPSLCLSL